MQSLNIVSVSHYIQTQIPSCLGVTGVGLYISHLGSLVEMYVASTEPIFKKKIPWGFLGDNFKLSHYNESLRIS